MRTLRNQARLPAATPLLADDVLEFHAGRLALLLKTCGGTAGAINGLTKMAKLDFFVRYPDFFDELTAQNRSPSAVSKPVETAMVRHHYGPWDKRYYHVLAYLESRDLISIKRSGKSFRIALTKHGKAAATTLANAPQFRSLREQMERVASALGSKSGNELKKMIYARFTEEVGEKPLGHVIDGKPQ
jgi:hypothetical protein